MSKANVIRSLGFVPVLRHGDILARESGHGYERYYRVGDVWSYSAESGDDPHEAGVRAVKCGHETVWANPESVCLDTSGMTPREKYARCRMVVWDFEYGDVVRICGKLFEVLPASNDNVQLRVVVGSAVSRRIAKAVAV